MAWEHVNRAKLSHIYISGFGRKHETRFDGGFYPLPHSARLVYETASSLNAVVIDIESAAGLAVGCSPPTRLDAPRILPHFVKWFARLNNEPDPRPRIRTPHLHSSSGRSPSRGLYHEWKRVRLDGVRDSGGLTTGPFLCSGLITLNSRNDVS